MGNYTFAHANTEKEAFAIYHAIYAENNISASFDWNEITGKLSSSEHGVFIFNGNQRIGGFTLNGSKLSHPFMIQPFCNRVEFWKLALDYAAGKCGGKEIDLTDINENDTKTLVEAFGAVKKWTLRMMLRPTSPISHDDISLDGYIFTPPEQKDKLEMIDVIYEAHSQGYTATVRMPAKWEIEHAVNTRFDLYMRTNSLHIGTLARDAKTGELAGVCLAGIYPDSPNSFSTVHQLSVRLKHQRKGIGKAMMLNSINTAHSFSPVVTLDVLVGNPAELLYKKLGFTPFPSYSDLTYKF